MTTSTGTQLTLAAQAMAPLAKDIKGFLDTVDGFDIADEDSCAMLGDMRKSIQQLERKVRAKKTEMRKPIAESLRRIDAVFKLPLQQLSDALESTKQKLDQWARDQLVIERERKRAEEIEAQKRRDEIQATVDDLRNSGASEVADELLEVAQTAVDRARAPARTEAVRGTVATVVTVKTWRAQVYSLKDLCKAIGDGLVPVDAVEPRMKVLHDLAASVAKKQSKNGFHVYEQVTTQTR